jgi:hypothetical protein
MVMIKYIYYEDFSFPKRSSVLFAVREYAVGESISGVRVKVARSIREERLKAY